jgi:hypothetical protein
LPTELEQLRKKKTHDSIILHFDRSSFDPTRFGDSRSKS